MSIRATARRGSFLLLIVTVLLLLKADAGARSLCWRPRPLADCRWCLVTEIGYGRILSYHNDTYSLFGTEVNRWRFFSEIGLVKNTSANVSVGMTFAGEGRGDGAFFAIKPRLRLWKGRNVSFDAGAGPVLFESFSRYKTRGVPVTGHVGVQLFGYTTISLHADYFPIIATVYEYDPLNPENSRYVTHKGHVSDLSAGISMNSYFFPAGVVGLGTLVVIAFIVALSTWD